MPFGSGLFPMITWRTLSNILVSIEFSFLRVHKAVAGCVRSQQRHTLAGEVAGRRQEGAHAGAGSFQ